MIAIVDCKTGDPHGVRFAFDRLGVDSRVVRGVEGIDRAQRIVIPSGGSFAATIRNLRDRGFVEPLLAAADAGRPILGISLGMHLLFDVSYEEGQHTGLGIVHGKVTRFDFGAHPAARSFSVPHQGWNEVHWTNGCPLTAGLPSGTPFFFDHSHYAEPLEARAVAAQSNYGIDFSAVIWQGGIFATQFLPERSQEAGLALLANFAAI